MVELKWLAVLLGLAVAAPLALLGRASGASIGSVGLEFVALALGAFASARAAGRLGVAHGLAVAVVFILGATAVQGWSEMQAATTLGPEAVGPVDLGRLIVTDLVDLGAGWLGGRLAGTGGLGGSQG